MMKKLLRDIISGQRYFTNQEIIDQYYRMHNKATVNTLKGYGGHVSENSTERSEPWMKSKTSSEASTTNANDRKYQPDLYFQASKPKIPARMTSSDKKPFNKSSSKLYLRQSGIELMNLAVHRRTAYAFRLLKQHVEETKPSEQKQPPADKQMCRKDHLEETGTLNHKRLLKRNSKAEELLQILPIKFKKKMRSLIEDYEIERGEFVVRINQLSSSVQKYISVQMDYSRLQQTIQNLTQQRAELLQSIELLLKSDNMELGRIKNKMLSQLGRRMQQMRNLNSELSYKLESLSSEYLELKNKTVEQATFARELMQNQRGSDTNLILSQPSECGSNSNISQGRNTANRFQLQNIQPSMDYRRNQQNSQYNRSVSPSLKSTLKVPAGENRSKLKLLRKGVAVEEISNSASDVEQEFGKEKVIQKKKLRKLVKNMTQSKTSEGKKEALDILANEIGLKLQQSDFYSFL